MNKPEAGSTKQPIASKVEAADLAASKAGKDATTTASSADAERWRRIAELAYARAEERGFTPGHEVNDWLEAEQQLDSGGTSSRE